MDTRAGRAVPWAAALAAAALAATGARAQGAPAGQPFQLRLVCEGVQRMTPRGDETDRALQTRREVGPASLGVGQVEAKRRVEVAIAGASARIRLPHDVAPNARGRGAGGWLPVSDLVVGEDEITGRVSLSMINHPAVRIDRVSGEIEISGVTHFAGACERAPDRPVERKF